MKNTYSFTHIMCALFIFMLLSIISSQSNASTAESLISESVQLTQKTRSVSQKELICLAKNIYYEAGGESTQGKIAVAKVTLNRAVDPNFPSSICGVVYSRNAKNCAFSWVCSKPRKTPPHNEMYQESLQIAETVMRGGYVDVSRGATFFHSAHVRPSWVKSLKKTARIGGHIFYASGKNINKSKYASLPAHHDTTQVYASDIIDRGYMHPVIVNENNIRQTYTQLFDKPLS